MKNLFHSLFHKNNMDIKVKGVKKANNKDDALTKNLSEGTGRILLTQLQYKILQGTPYLVNNLHVGLWVIYLIMVCCRRSSDAPLLQKGCYLLELPLLHWLQGLESVALGIARLLATGPTGQGTAKNVYHTGTA